MVVRVGIFNDKRKAKPWVVRWFGEYDPETGKKKRYSKSFRLKRQAEEFKTEMTEKFRRGQQRDRPAEVALNNFCEDWLKTKEPEIRRGTLVSYKETIARLYEFFGKKCLLSKVTTYEAAKFISELEVKRAYKRARQLSNWTRKKILRNCRIIFKAAITWHLIEMNPFENIKSPKVATSRWHYMNPTQYRTLLSVAPTLRCKALYALCYTGGLRRGEALSLTWNDIDFERGEVMIENNQGTKEIPPFRIKDYEARSVPLPQHTLDILTELYAEAEEGVPYVLIDKDRFETVSAKWQQIQKEGKQWENRFMTNNTLQNFKRHVRWTKIEPTGTLSIHTLRKCCGKNWADHLPANVTKELMGHSKIETTMTFYNQVDKDQRRKAATIINELVSENKPNLSDAEMTPEG